MNKDALYFLGQDVSGHWYVVPESKSKAWYKWTDLKEDDERAWVAPQFASPIDHPNSFLFRLREETSKGGDHE